MKVGIYLAYRPYKKGFSLKHEGLGRYIVSLVKNLSESGNKIVIACPYWFLDVLAELFEDYGEDINTLELITTKKDPLLLKIFYSKNRIKKPVVWKGQIAKYTYKFIERVLDFIIAVKSVITLLLFSIFFLFFAIVILPFIAFPYIIVKFIEIFFRKIFKVELNKDFVKDLIRKVNNLSIIKTAKQWLGDLFRGDYLAEKIRENAAQELKYYIEKMVNPADVWYSPTAFWPEFNDINALTITCIPDLVCEEFALNFSCSNSPLQLIDRVSKISKTVEKGKYFVTYCDYVKETLLVNKFSVDRSNIRSILMFTNDLFPEIDVQNAFKYHINANYIFARELLQRLYMYNINSLNSSCFISDVSFSFDDIKYIFYSSQVRESKNILNLVRAYDFLLRKEKVTCKLFLTGNYEDSPELKEYIYIHNLQNDVLCFWNVPNQILAALYACAELSVNPTLYEGGFPFTFSEGMSVGTPSVMSRIPQVEEFVFGWDLEDCLFDPYNFVDIADKILYGLNNRDLLIQKQYPLFKQHYDRTKSGQAGKEYAEAFEYFMNLDKAKK